MENLIFALGAAVIGIMVVFIGLVILIVFIKILSLINAAISGEKKHKKATPAAPQMSAPPVSTAAAPVQSSSVPADVVAAITAAIAAIWQSPNGFVVRHVKRISNAPAWNRAGREEQTYSRF